MALELKMWKKYSTGNIEYHSLQLYRECLLACFSEKDLELYWSQEFARYNQLKKESSLMYTTAAKDDQEDWLNEQDDGGKEGASSTLPPWLFPSYDEQYRKKIATANDSSAPA